MERTAEIEHEHSATSSADLLNGRRTLWRIVVLILFRLL